MKLLICVSQIDDIKSTLSHFSIKPNTLEGFPGIHTCTILQHEVDILVTCANTVTTTYTLTKLLTKKKYHLALHLSKGTAYKADYIPGYVLNIVNEKPGDCGTINDGNWIDLYDSGQMNRTDPPHTRGGFINLNNAYMNIFAPYKKVVGITVNYFRDKENWNLRQEKYNADCETQNGLAFSYTCLSEKQSYYHLTFIDHNMVSGITNKELAIGSMNEQLKGILQKL
ncbi:MAG: hypothetical protein KA841_08240 [Chitinophagales bacterium]|nr:hypothetical protein [Chitinophagales bacterium]